MKRFILSALALVTTSSFASADLTHPISVKITGLYKTSQLVALHAAIVPELDKAVTKACGKSFFVTKLDTHTTFEQPEGAGTASYSIEGTVTCHPF
jgi:hypothetical protein